MYSIFTAIWLLFLSTSALCLQTAAGLKHETGASDIRGTAILPFKTCYEDVLAVQQSVPSLTSEIQPLMLTQAIVSIKDNTVRHLRCEGTQRHISSHGWPTPHRGTQLKLLPYETAAWGQLQKTCNSTMPGLSVALGRLRPLNHFGHRMLADLPALYALKTFLLDHAVDTTNVRVVFLDDLGQPVYGTENFKPILNSLGYSSYEVLGDKDSSVCFSQVILMPVTFYPKWIRNEAGRPVNMWKAPEALYDVDAFHIAMVGDIRAAFGLPRTLPFASPKNRTIILASRNSATRERLGLKMSRILLNEDQLFKALLSLPDVHVLQMDMGSMPMNKVIHLLDRTSLFMGYHGAAFDNCVFLPRGAYILEILPKGTNHSPLYPSLAQRTGKEYARYVNEDASRQTCRRTQQGEKVEVQNCLNHQANLKVDVSKVLSLVKSVLHTQQAAMQRYSFDELV